VTKTDWDHWKRYDEFIAAAERLVMRTSRVHAPWMIVEGEDPRYRSLAVGRRLRDAIRSRFDVPTASATPEPAASTGGDGPDAVDSSLGPAFERTVFSTLDMDADVDRSTYDTRLPEAQARLNRAYRRARDAGRSTVLVFEGWDAGGKGGAIRRLAAAMDARDYQVIPIAAPSDEERARPYLWRFWRQLGRAGRVTIYDRSWYGRVLVERVEGLARSDEWRRAYTEINDFERQLVESGIIVVKFWLHITPEEQLRRFERRQEIPFKRWKLTDEDWRNREKWSDYERAAHQMIGQTSTSLAPWRLVPANSKRFARLAVLDTVCDALEDALEG
jgi:polyphosphate:AMP phosphotransferase